MKSKKRKQGFIIDFKSKRCSFCYVKPLILKIKVGILGRSTCIKISISEITIYVISISYMYTKVTCHIFFTTKSLVYIFSILALVQLCFVSMWFWTMILRVNEKTKSNTCKSFLIHLRTPNSDLITCNQTFGLEFIC